MPATKPVVKIFSAVLERMNNPLNWVIVRIPFDVAKLWGKRGQLRIQGDINGFSFSSTLFPTGKGTFCWSIKRCKRVERPRRD
jgi:Domain of unknown function (DUF1905)